MESDWLAESLADLGRLIRSLKTFPMPMDFFFDFFAVREIWSAMDMSARGRKDTRQCQGICHFGASEGARKGRFPSGKSQALDFARQYLPCQNNVALLWLL